MNRFEVFKKVTRAGEYILGKDTTGTHACYMIYGVLKPGEKERELRPGAGHEELVLIMEGTATLSGHVTGQLSAGQAIHLRGDERCLAANSTERDVVYVIAGGHTGQGHH